MTLYVDDYVDLPETPPPAPRALSVAYHAAIGTLEQLHAEEYTDASAWLSDNDEGQSDDDDDMPSLQSVSDSEDDESDYEDDAGSHITVGHIIWMKGRLHCTYMIWLQRAH